jgi:cytochrome c
MIKQFGIALVCSALFIACGNNSNKNGSTEQEETTEQGNTEEDISSNPDYQKGLELIGKNDCLTCHKVSETLIGPSYQEVANKYAGSDTAVEYLSKKIIEGGSGVWGTVPMTPHPQLSKEDAEQMTKYILLLKTK